MNESRAYQITIDRAMIAARAQDSLAAQIGALSVQVHEAAATIAVQNQALAQAAEQIANLEAQANERQAVIDAQVAEIEMLIQARPDDPVAIDPEVIEELMAERLAQAAPGAITPINKHGRRK